MLERPPQHRVDAPIIFVHPADAAWDMERYTKERDEMDDPAKHPLARYFGGWTRYDISAIESLNGVSCSPIDYLDENKRPTKWHLRRLTHDEWYEVKAMVQKSYADGIAIPTRAYARCCEIGIKKVENGPELIGPPRSLTNKDMQLLFEYRTTEYDLISDIGMAVYSASLPLSEAEKKA